MGTDKKYDINSLMTRKDMIEKVTSGKKTAIRRNNRYADIGDTFKLENKEYEMVDVYQQKLGDVTEENAQEEGFHNLDEYKESITSIHEGAVWTPKLTVWVHEFKQKE